MVDIFPRILVADDEPQIRKFLRAVLSSHNYDVTEVETGKEAINQLALKPPDLLILDLGLPDMDGLTLLKDLRSWSELPVIVLSARGQEQTKVNALELGADDYLTKPFGTAELLARIKVALKHATNTTHKAEPIFEVNGLRLDAAKRIVAVNEKEIKLTPTEYKLLITLVKYAGKSGNPWAAVKGGMGVSGLLNKDITYAFTCSICAKNLVIML